MAKNWDRQSVADLHEKLRKETDEKIRSGISEDQALKEEQQQIDVIANTLSQAEAEDFYKMIRDEVKKRIAVMRSKM